MHVAARVYNVWPTVVIWIELLGKGLCKKILACFGLDAEGNHEKKLSSHAFLTFKVKIECENEITEAQMIFSWLSWVYCFHELTGMWDAYMSHTYIQLTVGSYTNIYLWFEVEESLANHVSNDDVYMSPSKDILR